MALNNCTTSTMRKLFLLLGLLTICFYMGLQLYQKFYARENYPNGKIKKSASFVISKNMFMIKEYYENGKLEALYYNKDLKTQGIMYIYTKEGNLKALNYFKDDIMYYKKVYKYDKSNYLVDSADALIPIIREFKLNDQEDTAIIKAQIILEGTKYKYGDLDLYFEVYDTIQPDGIFPYTPTDSTTFNSPEVKTILFPIVPIAKNPKKFYLGMVIREKVNGEKVEHEPVVREIELK